MLQCNFKTKFSQDRFISIKNKENNKISTDYIDV